MKPLQTENSSWRKVLTLAVGLACTLDVAAQNFNVKGSVTDQNGEPIIGATIMEEGTKNGVVTDIDGHFTLPVTSAKSRIRVTYIGYKTQEIPVAGKSDFNVKLQEDAANLDEVVVVGYGTMDKKELTSAVSHVSSKNFTQVASVDPSMMIQGKVAGVSITNTGAGDPNNQASIQVRGVSSRAA
ncbi:carboxypeptidase-like regulatory domain-containing protein, partial [Prevotella sp.]